MIYMEKLVIPLDGNMDLEALKVLNKTSKSLKNTPSKSKAGINFSSIHQANTTTNDITKRSLVLPRITRGSKGQITETTMGIKEKNASSYLNRKFDFIVPQHKMSKPEDKYGSHLNGNMLDLNDTMQTAQEATIHMRSADVRVPFPFSLEDADNEQKSSPRRTDDRSPTTNKGDVVPQTLDKVFGSMALDGFKLSGMKR